MVKDRPFVKKLLRATRWLAENRDTVEDVLDAVKRFQSYFGLNEDGQVGPKTIELLGATRFCSVDEPPAFGAGLRRWDKTQLTYSVTLETQVSIDPQTILAEFRSATAEISEHCGLRFEYITDFRAADIQVHFGSNMGGASSPGSVLADSHLPPADPVIQRYDRAETWSTSPRGGIWLYLVALHELLHAVGLEHVSPRVAKAVVNPIYDPAIDQLQPYDIQQLRSRYGTPQDTADLPPTPETPQDPPADANVTVINAPRKVVIYS